MTSDPDLDRALSAWGRADLADDAAVERLAATAHAIAQPARPKTRRWPWSAAAAAAAAVIVVLLVQSPGELGLGTTVGQTSVSSGADDTGGDLQFAAVADHEIDSFLTLYTPTADEEYLI